MAICDLSVQLPLARQRLAEAIAEAARNGVRQSVIVKITGYQRERIRTITRVAGIRPDGNEDLAGVAAGWRCGWPELGGREWGQRQVGE